MNAPLIIQRVIPNYRIALFEEVHRRTGARVVAADSAPGGTFLNFANPRDHDWAIPMPFGFPDPQNAFTAEVPLERILDLRPTSVVAEFGVRMSSTRMLPRARKAGRVRRFAFWSHGWQMERGFSSPADLAVQHLRLMLLSKADAHAAYTNEGAAWLRKRFPRVPVIALGNALDLTAIDRAAAAARATRGGSPQFLAVGRLTADKRFDSVVEIFRRVRVDHPDAALTIIGDGPERARLEQVAAADLGRGIQFTGALHDEAALAPHFLGADFLVMPGAAGLTVNHALAYKLPVVAFARSRSGPRHHPEIEYVVDGASGILVKEPDAELMARRISAAVRAGEHKVLRRKLEAGSPAPPLDGVASRFEELLNVLEAPIQRREAR